MPKTPSRYRPVSQYRATSDALICHCFYGGASELVFWSFRYFLGRMTGATIFFAESLAQGWHHIDRKHQKMICSELDEAFKSDDEARAAGRSENLPLGMDCDRAAWQLVRDAYSDPASNPPTITHD